MKELAKRQTRDYSIDNLRAFSILIVMFGHSIILYSSQWSLYSTSIEVPFLDITKKIINIFQMPLFFFDLWIFVLFYRKEEKSI